MLIPRRIISHLDKLGNFFPAISLTGPRQSGKTTLLKELYPDYKYVSLEHPPSRLAAINDPEAFLSEYNDRVIFDEAQLFPELFSYLQGMIDNDRRPGRFILSGSQNFLLRKNITQSLAGRVGIAKLLPLDLQELKTVDRLPENGDDAIHLGGYPGRISNSIDQDIFYAGYLASYIERDVTDLISANNLKVFQLFLRNCAVHAGQMINTTKMAREVGVSAPTIQSWLGILEQSYIIFRLPPFFRNLGKRLTKAHKLYFYDTGLLTYLLGIHSVDEISNLPQRGALFENLIISDAFKSFHHQGYEPRFYFYRDQSKREVDLVYEKANLARLWEIKSADIFRPRHLDVMQNVATFWDRPVESKLIYQGDEERRHSKSMLVNWRNAIWER